MLELSEKEATVLAKFIFEDMLGFYQAAQDYGMDHLELDNLLVALKEFTGEEDA